MLCSSTSFAQGNDTLSKAKKPHPYPVPAKAMLFSAILPGSGQFYNKKYWKIPIVYAGLGTAAYFIITNNNYFNTYNNALKDTSSHYYHLYGSSTLSNIVTYYHRNRDISVIAAVAVYLLNIVDANVDAQMHGFNVSDDISFRLSPTLLPNPLTGGYSFQPGITVIKRL
jgi:hypothetical protein